MERRTWKLFSRIHLIRGAILSTLLLSRNDSGELGIARLRITDQMLGMSGTSPPALRCALPISAADSITFAVEHTKQQLFKPFRFWQWTKLAVVGLLAGELGGGFNGNNFNFPKHAGASPHSQFPGFGGIDFAVLAGLISVIIIAAFLLGIIFMYISSVMRFILFDSIIAKECHIRRGWMLRQGPGWRYFLWKLVFGFITLGGFVVLVGIPLAFAFAVGWLREAKEHVLPLVLGGIVVFLALMIFLVAISVILVLTKDFVVPQMALENISAFEGWQRLWHMIAAEKGAYAGYVGMKILMAIGAGIVTGIATLILGLIVAIPTVGLSILAVLTGKTAGLTWNAYTITLAIVVGSVLLTGFLYLVSLICVPVIVFFPAYSIYFFAARYRPLSAVLYPLPPAAAMTAPSVPPLPPAPEPAG